MATVNPKVAALRAKIGRLVHDLCKLQAADMSTLGASSARIVRTCLDDAMKPLALAQCVIGNEVFEQQAERRGPECGHSACSQNYIETGDASCIEGTGPVLTEADREEAREASNRG